MAAKRCLEEDDEHHNQKRTKTRPSFASVIREVVMVNFFENFCSAMEPMLRRVVSEEVENGLTRVSVQQYPPPAPPARLQLAFDNSKLSLPIFTGTKILDANGNPLRIILVDDTHTQVRRLPGDSNSFKLEIVVLDGDFPADQAWSSREFTNSIVKERTGKRPLLSGEMTVTMRTEDGDGAAASVGDIEFTDNSSWIRSRKFRIGARLQVNPGRNPPSLIGEAVTEAFVVKDHRGELYKKNHPPVLEDEVWRLEKIGKGGAFHQKLAGEGINTVQDFLKLFHVDSARLRKIVGVAMSERMWEATVKHAQECVMGSKVYLLHGDNYTLTLNPICQPLGLHYTNGDDYSHSDLSRMHSKYIESLVKEAYTKWNSLEVIMNEEAPVNSAYSHPQLLHLTHADKEATEVLHNHSIVSFQRHQQQQSIFMTPLRDDCDQNSCLSIIKQRNTNDFMADEMEEWGSLSANSNTKTNFLSNYHK